MIGASRLDIATYEDVEADVGSNAEAGFIVLLSSVAAAFGIGVTSPGGLASLTLAALVSWVVWAVLTYIIGARILPMPETRADIGELLRTTGISSAPGILRIFGFVPVVGWWIYMGVTVWMLFAFVVAVRQALDYTSSKRALAVCVLGWLIHGVLFFAFVQEAM
jgi:hypothetical protein